MNYDDFNDLQRQEKALQIAKERFFRQYKVDNDSFRSELFIDKDGKLALQIIPKGWKEPFQIIGDDIKVFYNLLAMLYNADSVKKEVETFKRKSKSEN